MKHHNPIDGVTHSVDEVVERIVSRTEEVVTPYRRSAFKRFPIIFTLATTFGVVATYFGFERVIMEIVWLNERPVLILVFGVLTLVLTGTLYKKLG